MQLTKLQEDCSFMNI